MRKNVPPIREPVFDAYIELPQRNSNLPPVRIPIKFEKTTRPWAQFFANLAGQANTGAEAEIAEDLFSGVSPVPSVREATEQDLFGNLSAVATREATEQDLFGGLPSPLPGSELSSLARHFLFMGA